MAIFLVACSANTKTDTESETAPIQSWTVGVEAAVQEPANKYPSQIFAYANPDGEGFLIEDTVRYYMDGNVFYTDRQYHILNIYFSTDDDNTMVYNDYVAFDMSQKPDSNGWYKVVIPDGFPDFRHPGSHVSAVILRGYFVGKPTKEAHRVADAYLYNTTTEIGRSSDRNVADSEVKKLIELINKNHK